MEIMAAARESMSCDKCTSLVWAMSHMALCLFSSARFLLAVRCHRRHRRVIAEEAGKRPAWSQLEPHTALGRLTARVTPPPVGVMRIY